MKKERMIFTLSADVVALLRQETNMSATVEIAVREHFAQREKSENKIAGRLAGLETGIDQILERLSNLKVTASTDEPKLNEDGEVLATGAAKLQLSAAIAAIPH